MTEKGEDSKRGEEVMTERADDKQVKAILDAGLVAGGTGLLRGSKKLVQAVFLGQITLGMKGNRLMFCKV